MMNVREYLERNIPAIRLTRNRLKAGNSCRVLLLFAEKSIIHEEIS